MNISVSEIGDINGTLAIPSLEGLDDTLTRLRISSDSNTPVLRGASNSTRAMVKNMITREDFTAKAGQTISILGGDQKVILVGMGDKDELDQKEARDGGAKFLVGLDKVHGKQLTIRFAGRWTRAMMAAFVEGMVLRDYKYDKYLSKDEDEDEDEEYAMNVQCLSKDVEAISLACDDISNIASGVHLARDLGNAPPNDLYPMAYAEQALEWVKGKKRMKVSVIDWEGILEAGMGGLENVGKGSERKPCMVIFEMNKPRGKSNPPVIVGKGITFDTGGISLKPGAAMDEMKYDMHGSATVFGLMEALYGTAHAGHVVGITCMAENMPSSNAYRPGDVIPTYSGKTIEVLNTDAEGRNVLADGLWKAGEFNPEYIIDLATLTGACVVALGHEASGLWSNDDELLEKIRKTAASVDELALPMPLLPAFEKEMTSSKIADVKNLGGRYGGSNTAAAFLKQFVPKNGEGKDAEQYPWAHLDIAGTAWGAKSNAMVAHGATGIHVRTLHKLITQQ